MKVTLLAYTPNPAEIAEIGAKTCYSSDAPSQIIPTEDKIALKRAVDSGHHSVLEHANFTFAVEGVSRALTHQLVRHRVASFSQQSQRYVKMDKLRDNIVIPQSVRTPDSGDSFPDGIYSTDEAVDEKINHYMSALESLAEELRNDGVPEEDIRYFYPNGLMTNIVVTMNARELLHFFSLRCCTRAQWEIRMLAKSMLALCKEVCPEIFENAGASCEQLGYCPEVKSCGKVITLKEIKQKSN